ncbi:MAG: AAA family ATPase [Chloroflexota bacterium]
MLANTAVRANLDTGGSHASDDDLALALAARLNTLIDNLRPAGQENLEQREFLHFYILHYLFQRGESAQVVQQKLGIGRTYLYKLRNEAVDNIATLLVATPVGRVPFLFAEPVPTVAGFVGRQAELLAYTAQLAQHKLALIHGFAGSGKTALAAQLADSRRQDGQPVLWITFCAGVNDTFSSLMGLLAASLAAQGHNDLQDFLRGGVQHASPYAVEAQIQYAANCLVASGVTLCLDDFHLVEYDPQIQRFLARLLPRQQAALVPTIIVSRYFPAFAQGRYIPPLGGLNDADLRLLFHQCDLDWVNEDIVATLQQRTEGNAAFVKLFITWAQSLGQDGKCSAAQLAQARQYIAQLGRSPASRNFLLGEMVAALMPAAQALLERLALCQQAVSLQGDGLAAFSPNEELPFWQDALLDIERRNLLVQEKVSGNYRLHELLRAFVLAQLDGQPERRMALHRLLAAYFLDAKCFLETAYHYSQAGEFSSAIALLVAEADTLIRDGHTAALVALFEKIPVAELQPALRLAWYAKVAIAWRETAKFDDDVLSHVVYALALVPQVTAIEYLARASTQACPALPQEQQNQRWDRPFLQSLAVVLVEKIELAETTMRRAQHIETSILNAAAVASVRLAVRQVQSLLAWLADTASYSLALLMAQYLDDGPTQREAYNQLGRTLTRLGRPQEAAQAYHKAFTWPGCAGLGAE